MLHCIILQYYHNINNEHLFVLGLFIKNGFHKMPSFDPNNQSDHSRCLYILNTLDQEQVHSSKSRKNHTAQLKRISKSQHISVVL